jgi:phosphoenolpyruvate synthase/pyruvate phosphate dikinase
MSQKWFVLKRNATLHHVFPITKSIVVDLGELLGVGFKRLVGIFRGGEPAGLYYTVDGIDAVARFMLRKMNTSDINGRVKNHWTKSARRLENEFVKLERVSVAELSSSALLRSYSDLIRHLERESAWGTLSDFLSSDLVSREITQQLTKIGIPKSNQAELLGIAASSTFESPYGAERKNFLTLARTFQRGGNIGNALRRHAQRYWYIDNDYRVSKKLSSSDFMARVRAYVRESKTPSRELEELKRKKAALLEARKKLLRQAHAKHNRRLVNLLTMTDIQVQLWDLKKVAMQKAFYYLDLLLSEVSHRSSVPFPSLKWYSPSEVEYLLRSGDSVPRAEIARRKTFCVLEVTPRKIKIVTGQNAKRLASAIEGKSSAVRVVRGQTGNGGKVRGVVNVMLDPHQRKVFKRNGVLVTGMTTPDFVPLMHKSRAIVTDEGGITCHAAIMSRELGIPCVIGTKIATKVFKDGDRVEVDATNGVVRKL